MILQKKGRNLGILIPDPLMGVKRVLGSLPTESFPALRDCLSLLLDLPGQYSKDRDVSLPSSPPSLMEASSPPFVEIITSQT